MRAALVGRQLGGMLVGFGFLGIFIGRNTLVRVAEDPPDHAHADYLGHASPALRFGFGFRGGCGLLFLLLLWAVLVVFVPLRFVVIVVRRFSLFLCFAAFRFFFFLFVSFLFLSPFLLCTFLQSLSRVVLFSHLVAVSGSLGHLFLLREIAS